MEKLKESDIFEIKIGNEKIKSSPSARNLMQYFKNFQSGTCLCFEMDIHNSSYPQIRDQETVMATTG